MMFSCNVSSRREPKAPSQSHGHEGKHPRSYSFFFFFFNFQYSGQRVTWDIQHFIVLDDFAQLLANVSILSTFKVNAML